MDVDVDGAGLAMVWWLLGCVIDAQVSLYFYVYFVYVFKILHNKVSFKIIWKHCFRDFVVVRLCICFLVQNSLGCFSQKKHFFLAFFLS